MILAFGGVVLILIGVISASAALPIALIVGGVLMLLDPKAPAWRIGFALWTLLSMIAVVACFYGLTGSAASGVKIWGINPDRLLGYVPIAWAGSLILGFGLWRFGIRIRRRAAREQSSL